MQNASPVSSAVLAPAPEYIPVSPLSYEAAEDYAMGMLSALQGTAALGAGLHIAGSLFIVYGQTLVKVAQLMEETSEAGRTWKLPLRQFGSEPFQWRSTDGKWRVQRLGSRMCMSVGWGIFGFGNLLRFAAMRFAAQMVLSGLGSLQFVMIPIVSNFLLGDKYTWEAFISIVLILGGNALIVVYGPAEVKFTLEQLRLQWTNTSMILFIVALGLLLGALHWGKTYVSRLRLEAQTASVRERWRAKAKNDMQLLVFAHALLFSTYAGLIGAWSVLFSKSITYIITAAWPSQVVDWYSWFCVLAFIGSAAFWIKATNQGLRLFSSSLIIPLMQAAWTAQSIVEGGIYFDEFKGAWTAQSIVKGGIYFDEFSQCLSLRVTQPGACPRIPHSSTIPLNNPVPSHSPLSKMQFVIKSSIFFDESQAMESDNLVWLLLGMILAIGGALFMGCAAFISEQHAMISHVIVLEDPLHPPAAVGTIFPLHNGGSAAPAPTAQSDWQHNMAALEERMRAGASDRLNKADAAKNSLGGTGPVANFPGPFTQGVLTSPKLGPVVPSLDSPSTSQQSGIVAEDIALDASPLNSARSADSANSMKSAFSTLHPASISGGQTVHSRRTSAVGERLSEFEDVYDDVEMGGRGEREDASLLRPDSSRTSHPHPHAFSDNLYDSSEAELERAEFEPHSVWSSLRSSAAARVGQATGSLRDKLRGKYAEYRESRL